MQSKLKDKEIRSMPKVKLHEKFMFIIKDKHFTSITSVLNLWFFVGWFYLVNWAFQIEISLFQMLIAFTLGFIFIQILEILTSLVRRKNEA